MSNEAGLEAILRRKTKQDLLDEAVSARAELLLLERALRYVILHTPDAIERFNVDGDRRVHM